MKQRDRARPRTTPKRRSTSPSRTETDQPAWVRERRPWDVSPANWRYFLGGAIALFLVAAGLTAVVLPLIGSALDRKVAFIALLVAGALVGMQWFGAVRATQVINSIARRHDLPTRPLRGATVLTGTVVILAVVWLAVAGLIANTHGGSRAIGAAVAEAFVPALLIVLLLFLIGRRTGAYVDEAAVIAEQRRRAGRGATEITGGASRDS